MGVRTVLAEPAGQATGRGDPAPRRAADFLRRHWPVIALLLIGAAVRLLVMRAYPPAFWFQGDSGVYIASSADVRPRNSPNPVGYAAFLWLFRFTGSLGVVALVQHVLAFALGAVGYAFLARRGLPPWLAALGVAPLLLDGRQITLEHFVLGDALFTVLLTSAVLVLLWRARPGPAACVTAGALATAAALTRSVGAVACAVLLGYLVVRAIGWKRILAFGLTVTALFTGFLTWSHAETGRWALSTMQERFLYARTAVVADCAKLTLTDEQRQLCPSEPVGQRPERPDHYLWVAPVLRSYGPERNDLIGSFATEVIRQQTGDFLGSVSRDVAKYLLPGRRWGPLTTCLANWWVMPADLRDTVPNGSRCKPLLADGDGFEPGPADHALAPWSTSRQFLADYSRGVQVPPVALGATVLLALAGLLWRPRRGRWRDGLDAALFVGLGLALIVVAVATSMFDVRYGVPSVALMSLGGALALHRLRTASAPDPEEHR